MVALAVVFSRCVLSCALFMFCPDPWDSFYSPLAFFLTHAFWVFFLTNISVLVIYFSNSCGSNVFRDGSFTQRGGPF